MPCRSHAVLVFCLAGAGLGPACDVAYAQETTQHAPSRIDGGGDLVARVRSALHADPALLDKHIDVVIQHGKVVLRGFVTTAEDLQKAKRAADVAAGRDNVIDQLTIKEGGDGGSG